MNIKRSVEKIPGGMMIVPLFLVACVNTFAPQFVPVAPSATAPIATAIVLTTLLTPFLTAGLTARFGVNSKRYQRRVAATAATEPGHGAI